MSELQNINDYITNAIYENNLKDFEAVENNLLKALTELKELENKYVFIKRFYGDKK